MSHQHTRRRSGRITAAALAAAFLAAPVLATRCSDDEATITTWTADHPVALLVIDDVTVLYAERLTGKVLRRDLDLPEAEPRLIAEVEVDSSGEQRGIVGLTRIGDQVFGAWVRPGDLRLVVGDVERGTLVWEGPVTDVKAIGGHLEVFDGRLLLGLGELVDDSDLAGTIVTLDPDGTPDQTPVVISRGWNNPFAFVVDNGQVVVADNAPDGEQERLGELPFPEDRQRAPSAIVVVSPGRYGVCGYIDGEMRGYRIEDGAVQRSGTLVDEGCRTSAVTLPDGRFVVADDDSIRLVDPPG
jgi:hypothetical protein